MNIRQLIVRLNHAHREIYPVFLYLSKLKIKEEDRTEVKTMMRDVEGQIYIPSDLGLTIS